MSKSNSQMELIPGGTITSPLGFIAGATHAGIKTRADKPGDLAILACEVSCAAAGLFTANQVKAAPVLLCQKHLAAQRARAMVVNSGCANACTGEQGLADAQEMAALTAKKLNIAPEEVLVASTGVIGMSLPMERIKEGISNMELSKDGGHQFARAIMTTDTFPKEAAVAVDLGEARITVAGVAKGAGMIHPNLATMLAFVTTDALVDGDFLHQALRRAADASFNMLTIDGDTSTNDSLLMLASGLSGSRIGGRSSVARAFQAALNQVCIHLARAIARDGEGSTRLIEVNVSGAMTHRDARRAARTIAASNAVKTAVHGADPNWGRIVAALGMSGARFALSDLEVYIDNICVMRGGSAAAFDREEARAILQQREVPIKVSLNRGKAAATAWGCDLSEEYVTLNSEYTT